MLEQAEDFRAESEALFALIEPLSDDALSEATAFKNWTIEDVVRHLHVWNSGAALSLKGELEDFMGQLMKTMGAGGAMRDFEREQSQGLQGEALVTQWRETFLAVADEFANADPSMRVKWVGPEMSVRSSITARLMETWAHGQEIYDQLGVVRINEDRIKNIVVLGLNTYGWTFKVRGEEAPEPRPYLRLTAPSGDLWTFGEENPSEMVEGLAEEFCQVVTQTRNIADTALRVVGPNAENWMSKAQCFAGPPETPPPPGARAPKK